MFDFIYSKILAGKLRGDVPYMDPLTGKPMNAEHSSDVSAAIQTLLDENWLLSIGTVAKSYNEYLLLSHILWKKDDRSISLCFFLNLRNLKNIRILVEADECIWDHYRERIGGYLYEDLLIKIDKPTYTQVDDKGFILAREISL